MSTVKPKKPLKPKKKTTAKKINVAMKKMSSINGAVGWLSNSILIYNVLHAIVTSTAGRSILEQITKGLGIQFMSATEHLRENAKQNLDSQIAIKTTQTIINKLSVYVDVAAQVRSDWPTIEKVILVIDKKESQRFSSELVKLVLDLTENPTVSAEMIKSSIESMLLHELVRMEITKKSSTFKI